MAEIVHDEDLLRARSLHRLDAVTADEAGAARHHNALSVESRGVHRIATVPAGHESAAQGFFGHNRRVLHASARTRRLMVRSLLGTAVGLLFLALAWRALGRSVSWRGVHFQALAIVLAFAGAFGFLAARAWRYHLLLPRHRSGASRMLGLTAVSWAIGLLIPGPSADASFIGLARTNLGVSAARATGVSLVARVLDVVSLAAVAVLAASLSGAGEPIGAVVAAGLAGAVGIGLLVAILMVGPRRAFLRRVARLPRFASWVERTDRNLEALAGRPRMAMLAASTVLCRVSTAVEYAAFFALIDLRLDFWQIWFALAIRSFLTAIPIQGLAGIGTSQAWWTTALVLEGVAAGPAVAASVTLQVLDLVVALSLSTVLALATARTWKRSTGAPIVAEPEPEEIVARGAAYAVRATPR